MEKGTLIDGELIAIGGTETLVPGKLYEAYGTVPPAIMSTFPESWVSYCVGFLYGLNNSNVKVLGAEVAADGSFRIQFEAKTYLQAGMGLAVAVLGGVVLTVLAGMKIQEVYEVVTGTGGSGSPLSAAVSIVTIVAVVGLGIWVWSEYKKAGR